MTLELREFGAEAIGRSLPLRSNERMKMAKHEEGRVLRGSELGRHNQARAEARSANSKSARRAARKINAQKHQANIRAKFGPSKRAAPVVVRDLSTGEVVGEFSRAEKPITRKQRVFIASLRAELGDEATDLPATSRGASALIDSLLKRKERRDRDASRVASATRPARVETCRAIEAIAARLGVEVQPSWLLEGEAQFVLDDLRARERRSRRVADGSAG